MILFRDYLRAHPEEAAAYAALKRSLAVRYGGDRERYTEAKTAFVEEILRLAKEEIGRGDPAPCDTGLR